MFSWLKSLFSTSPVGAIVDIADNAFYTEQEKEAAATKRIEVVAAFQTATLPQNVARRFIAFQITVLFTVCVICVLVGYFFDKQFSEFAMQLLKTVVIDPFMVIIGFYFSVAAIKEWKKKD